MKKEDIIKTLLLQEKKYHSETAEHSIRCAELIMKLAKEVGYTGNIAELGTGALLHDIGKIDVPITILNKPGLLTSTERQAIDRHAIDGYMILKKFGCFTETELNIVLYHHDHTCDLIEAKLMSVVDIFDALSHDRCYKKAFSIDTTFEIMSDMVQKRELNYYIVKCLRDIINRERQVQPEPFTILPNMQRQ